MKFAGCHNVSKLSACSITHVSAQHVIRHHLLCAASSLEDLLASSGLTSKLLLHAVVLVWSRCLYTHQALGNCTAHGRVQI